MSMAASLRCVPEWLRLRENADAAARSDKTIPALREHLAGLPQVVIRDLGCGTGSMGRWLSSRLPGPQRWIMQDRDPVLLRHAKMARTAADGSAVTAVTEQWDLTRMRAAHLAGTSLVTTSALLDLLTADEVDDLAEACTDAACPALLTLSVVGKVALTPYDPLDAEIEDAFNAHQRRVTGGRRLLGPDAVRVTVEAFERRGATVEAHPSPWRLGSEDAALIKEWLIGRVTAACAERPALVLEADAYMRRRLEACAAGELRAVIHHSDVLALPGTGAGS